MSGFHHPTALARLRQQADASRNYHARVVRPGRTAPNAAQGGRLTAAASLVVDPALPLRLDQPRPLARDIQAGGPALAGAEVAAFAHDADVRVGDWLRLTPPSERDALEPVRWVVVTAAPPVGRGGADRLVWVAPPPVGAVAPEG